MNYEEYYYPSEKAAEKAYSARRGGTRKERIEYGVELLAKHLDSLDYDYTKAGLREVIKQWFYQFDHE
jgi:hypothetical protein